MEAYSNSALKNRVGNHITTLRRFLIGEAVFGSVIVKFSVHRRI